MRCSVLPVVFLYIWVAPVSVWAAARGGPSTVAVILRTRACRTQLTDRRRWRGERGDYTQSQSHPPRVPPDTAVSSPPSILQRSSNSTSLALLKAFIYPGERLGETQTFVLKCDRDQRASGTNERATQRLGSRNKQKPS